MMVKDVSGNEFNAASNGKANAGLTLGIIGTGLAALSGGLLNGGLFNAANVSATAPIQEQKYYEDTIANMKEFFAYAQGVSDRICNLEQRVAVDETAISKNFEYMGSQNDWQNKFYDEKFRYADLLEQCRISDATCKCIKGEVYASPSDIADPYIGSRLILGSRQVYPEYTAYNSGCGCGCGTWNTWTNGCGCN
nr:MAG TPA: hypothetical protein [Caudoviricetes sp.]DAT69688.1 MAG TPA: hypothetical protein [Caudoviricetes sp.]